MLPLEVVFDVPPAIVRGLASGALERVGGVIRETGSKQVVMWLREGAQIANNSNLAGGVLKSLLNVGSGGLTGVAFGALDAVVAANRHNQIMQQFGALTNLVGVVGGVGVLNLATSVVSAGIMLKRLSDLERAIESLYHSVSREFSDARKVKMQAAIQAASDALNLDGQAHRDFQANSAIIALFAARQHLWNEINTLKGSNVDAANNEVMQENILQAMQLDALRSRCLLELNNVTRAKLYLDDKLEAYRETSRLLVHRHLGEHRAVYFHKSVAERDLRRYLAIEQWLHTEDYRLMDILLATRHDFWNPALADHSRINTAGQSAGFQLPFRSKEASDDYPYIEALTQSELLIENQRRFEGILGEIEAIERLGIKHSELEQQQEEALAKEEINLAEHKDFVLIVNKEWLAEQSDSMAA